MKRRAISLAFIVAVTIAPAGPPFARVPFGWTPGQIEVAVRVNGTPATFLLDTGAEYSVVSSRLAALLGLATEQSGSREFADNVTLRLKGVDLPHQRVMVMRSMATTRAAGGSTAWWDTCAAASDPMVPPSRSIGTIGCGIRDSG